MIDDGSYVRYVGKRPSDGVSVGNEGIVVSASDTGAHVSWYSGSQTGKITLVAKSRLEAVEGIPHHSVHSDELGLEDSWDWEGNDLLEDGWY